MSLFFQERHIVGHSRDTIQVRHLTLEGSNYEIGRKIGELARDCHHVEKAPAADPLTVRCQRLYLQDHYPIYYERMRGIAEAFGRTVTDDRYDFSLLGDPILCALGCSAVSYPPSTTTFGHGIVSKNEDYLVQSSVKPMFGLQVAPHDIPALAQPYIVEMYPDNGYASLSFMSFEMFGESLDGINDQGLAVVHLADCESPQNGSVEPTLGSGVGLNELKCVQFLLDTCANVDEAKQALLVNKHFYAYLPVHLLVADRRGHSFVWEYSSRHNKEYIIDGRDRPQVVTNFLLHPYLGSRKPPHVSEESGCMYNRYRTLEAAVGSQDQYTLNFIKKTNARVFITDRSFAHPTELRTIWHSIFDTTESSVQVSFHLRDAERPGEHHRVSVRSAYYKFCLDAQRC